MVWLIDCQSFHKNMEFIQWIKSQHPQTCLMFVLTNCTSKFQLANVSIQHPFKHVFKKEFHMWTSCTIKNQLLKEKDLEVDFCMLVIKPKLCGWLFHEWTQMCERKEMIYKSWGKTCLLRSFILYFYMEALGVNVTKSLLSSYLIRKAKVENPNSQENSNLDFGPK